MFYFRSLFAPRGGPRLLEDLLQSAFRIEMRRPQFVLNGMAFWRGTVAVSRSDLDVAACSMVRDCLPAKDVGGLHECEVIGHFVKLAAKLVLLYCDCLEEQRFAPHVNS